MLKKFIASAALLAATSLSAVPALAQSELAPEVASICEPDTLSDVCIVEICDYLIGGGEPVILFGAMIVEGIPSAAAEAAIVESGCGDDDDDDDGDDYDPPIEGPGDIEGSPN